MLLQNVFYLFTTIQIKQSPLRHVFSSSRKTHIHLLFCPILLFCCCSVIAPFFKKKFSRLLGRNINFQGLWELTLHHCQTLPGRHLDLYRAANSLNNKMHRKSIQTQRHHRPAAIISLRLSYWDINLVKY